MAVVTIDPEARQHADHAQREATEARRESAATSARVDSLADTVRDHRAESQAAHSETQRLIRELSGSVGHLQGRATIPPPETTRGDRNGAIVIAGTIATAVLVPLLLAAAAAMGLPVVQPAHPAPVSAAP